MKITKDVPVVGKYDVIVCGGGPSGWVAAVAAARSGAKTALIERFGYLGGAATSCYVVPISGFFKKGERVVGGIAWEFVEKTAALGAATVELPRGHVSFDPEYYKLVSARMLNAAGVDFYGNSYLSGAVSANGKITAVTFENKNGTEALEGKVFVDATGDGDLCFLSGVPTETYPEMQPLSFCFELSGVDTSTELLCNKIHHDGKFCNQSVVEIIHDRLDEYRKEGKCPVFGGPWFNTLVIGNRLAVNITRSTASVLDNRAYTKAEMQLREDMFAIFGLLKKSYPEFANACISGSAVNAGVRDGRHLVGVHKLSGDELLEAVHFEDSIARNAHPVDIHRTDGSGQILKSPKQSGYIPYRSLISPTCGNIIVAGRNLSADETAHATVRVQATVMATGQAAGTAAAMSAASGVAVNALDAKTLQARLLDGGAII